MIMIIQLTPHRGFSVTDYIKYYYAYLYYLLSVDYSYGQVATGTKVHVYLPYRGAISF
jgi:hypothetical protein